MRELTAEEIDGVSGGSLFGSFAGAFADWALEGIVYLADHPPKFRDWTIKPTW